MLFRQLDDSVVNFVPHLIAGDRTEQRGGNLNRQIEFPFHEEVEVSIIIPVFNQFPFTQACLASLQEHQGTERFEVTIVDDCSTDETREAIPQIQGVVYLRNEKAPRRVCGRAERGKSMRCR